MRKLVTLDWQILADDEWEHRLGQVPPVGLYNQRTQRLWHSLFAGALLAVVAWLASTYLWTGTQAETARLPSEHPSAMELENKAEQSEELSPLMTMQIQPMKLDHRLTAVEVVVTQTTSSGLPFAYRETRFYRKTEHGWLLMTPPPDFWGEPGSLETANLHFFFHERDRETVERIAAILETQYANLHQLLGLPAYAADKKLSIEIVPRPLATVWRTTSKRILAPSPILLPIPLDGSRETVLERLLGDALLSYGMNEVLRQTPVRGQWQSMVAGLQRWLQRHDIILSYHRQYLPDEWQTQLSHDAPPQPVALGFLLETAWVEEPEQQTRIVFAQTLIEYSVATYGLQSLPLLLRAFGQCDDWTTLVPAVFGVTAAELEAGWHAYLLHKKKEPLR